MDENAQVFVMRYWLCKTEPGECSIDDIHQRGTEPWTGIRNYTVRNYIRDNIHPGDYVFIYHSSIASPHIAGIGIVSSEAYPDPTQFDAASEYFDSKSQLSNPRWLAFDIRYLSHASPTMSLTEMRANPALQELAVLRRGNRLSITPVAESEAKQLLKLIGYPEDPAPHGQ
jgi:predicted RNA-binding protein with PUA-like domain